MNLGHQLKGHLAGSHEQRHGKPPCYYRELEHAPRWLRRGRDARRRLAGPGAALSEPHLPAKWDDPEPDSDAMPAACAARDGTLSGTAPSGSAPVAARARRTWRPTRSATVAAPMLGAAQHARGA